MRHTVSDRTVQWLRRWLQRAILALPLAIPINAHASLFSGDTLDAVANVISWIVLFVAPIIAIGVFLMVHILPEKVAEKRKHPQLSAIKTLCILSLFFGGMLWPIAWLWAYSKPVLHKIAYDTDVHEPEKEVASTGEVEHRSADSKPERMQVDERDRHSAGA